MTRRRRKPIRIRPSLKLAIEKLESRLTPSFSPTVYDLEWTEGPALIGGFVQEELARYATSSIGDFNGDGYDDFIVGTTDTTHGSNPNPSYIGRSFVRFGSPTDTSTDYINSSNPSFNDYLGFEIVGVANGDMAYTAGGGGDINGDGFDDIIIGAVGVDRWVSSGTVLVSTLR